jgi:hypothetical protein
VSAYCLLFADEQRTSAIPDLNAEVIADLNMQELPVSKKAPSVDDI